MTRLGEVLASHLKSFGKLDSGDCAALGALDGEVRKVKRNTDIFRRGDSPKHVVVVLDGLLFRYTLGHEGARQIHSFYLATEAPSLESLYLDYMDNNLGTVIDSTLGFIPHDQLYDVIDKRPGVRKLIFRETLVQGAIFREWLMRNSNMPAHACIAHFFCEMFTRGRAAGLTDGDTLDLRISQQMLSDAVGLTSVHTNRTLMLLRQTGAVEWRDGKLTIHDWAKLCEIAEFDPYYLHLRKT